MARRPCEEKLEKVIGYRFAEAALLREALTHKSFSNEQQDGPPCNERLEFLGDAVLDLAVSRAIFRDYPGLDEGEMTRVRAEMVSERALAALARELDLGGCLLLGRGEERSGGRSRESLLADALEALLGAVFCDSGFETVCPMVDRLFAGLLARSVQGKTVVDHKTVLQEKLQGRFGRLPVYELTGCEGPDHDRTYSIAVLHDGEVMGRGRGRTKKGAEQEAARQALEHLERGGGERKA